MRQLSVLDQIFNHLERSLRAVHGRHQGTARSNPGNNIADTDLSEPESRHAASLMRVNHAGEIAAQALYNGQSLAARSSEVKERMRESAQEETDHLAWCKQRVEELGQSTSLLGPVWYWGSFSIGAIAGAAGDKWSLGFIKETEDQVISHLQEHQQSLPDGDTKSRAIIQQMIIDEAHHGDKAVDLGGVPLPAPAIRLMRLTARVMTTVSYRI
ncbi:MAG: demethoxyubiquinone hydroxylase family protein [Thiothrix sp.]|nr:MAG: demethoxyubiquinone hydroxylase family protein [Thiothrix sp.]